MTKLKRKSRKQIIVSNKQKKLNEKWQLIDLWLPQKYAKEVNKLLPLEHQCPEHDLSYIRHVRTKKINNDMIINALYLVANVRRIQIQKMEV